MKERTILGYIDCPTCGAPKGMRVTLDKNAEPFGYCQAECGQQLRVGGDPERVAAFVARYPFAAGQAPASQAEPPVTVTEAKPVQPPAPQPVTEPPPPTKKPAAPRNPFDDALRLLGGKS